MANTEDSGRVPPGTPYPIVSVGRDGVSLIVSTERGDHVEQQVLALDWDQVAELVAARGERVMIPKPLQ